MIKSELHASITRQAVLNHGYAWKPVAWLAQDLARIIQGEPGSVWGSFRLVMASSNRRITPGRVRNPICCILHKHLGHCNTISR